MIHSSVYGYVLSIFGEGFAHESQFMSSHVKYRK